MCLPFNWCRPDGKDSGRPPPSPDRSRPKVPKDDQKKPVPVPVPVPVPIPIPAPAPGEDNNNLQRPDNTKSSISTEYGKPQAKAIVEDQKKDNHGFDDCDSESNSRSGLVKATEKPKMVVDSNDDAGSRVKKTEEDEKVGRNLDHSDSPSRSRPTKRTENRKVVANLSDDDGALEEPPSAQGRDSSPSPYALSERPDKPPQHHSFGFGRS